MTTATVRDTDTPGLTSRQIRDLVALLLVLAGLTGLAVVAFCLSWKAGAAVLSTAAVAAGAALAYQRPER